MFTWYEFQGICSNRESVSIDKKGKAGNWEQAGIKQEEGWNVWSGSVILADKCVTRILGQQHVSLFFPHPLKQTGAATQHAGDGRQTHIGSDATLQLRKLTNFFHEMLTVLG